MTTPDIDAPASLRTLAELARAGFFVLRQPAMRVAYEVHHVQDRPGYLYDLLGGTSKETPHYIGTLTSAAYGTGLVIGTRAEWTPTSYHNGNRSAIHPDVQERDNPEAGTRIFVASAAPNISFVYDSTQAFEGIIAIETEPMPVKLRHGRAILAVLEAIADVAHNVAQGPVIWLQSPVQLPLNEFGDGGGEPAAHTGRSWPRASAPAVRFGIALERPSARLRLKIADSFLAFCNRYGFGLWTADTRCGYRAGNWFTVRPHDKNRTRSHFDGAADPKGDGQAHASLPVTFVGPAGGEAARTILRYLAEYPELGVISCAMTVIGDIAFIHLQLSVAGAVGAHASRLNAAMAAMGRPVQDYRPPERLAELMRCLELSKGGGEVDPVLADDVARHIGAYHVLVGPAQPVRHEHKAKRGALWVSWEVQGSEADLAAPFTALHQALEELGLYKEDPSHQPNVEYLACRRVRNSVLRGRGKLVLPAAMAERYAGREDFPGGLSRLSEEIENVWRSRLDATHKVRELTVAWREYWLGRWTSPLD